MLKSCSISSKVEPTRRNFLYVFVGAAVTAAGKDSWGFFTQSAKATLQTYEEEISENIAELQAGGPYKFHGDNYYGRYSVHSIEQTKLFERLRCQPLSSQDLSKEIAKYLDSAEETLPIDELKSRAVRHCATFGVMIELVTLKRGVLVTKSFRGDSIPLSSEFEEAERIVLFWREVGALACVGNSIHDTCLNIRSNTARYRLALIDERQALMQGRIFGALVSKFFGKSSSTG